jgi:hypothetical protein
MKIILNNYKMENNKKNIIKSGKTVDSSESKQLR